MAPSQAREKNYPAALVTAGLIFLLSTLTFGLLAGIQYIYPGFLRDSFSFEKIRPLHVSSAVFWILTAAAGSVLTFLQEQHKILRGKTLIKIQFYVFTITFSLILISYFAGIFGGREYWAFHPLFALPIIVGWILFLITFFLNLSSLKSQPVYTWMWLTGAVFFLFTYLESNLWIIPGMGKTLSKDMAIQWKSYGSLVGSWNMLIYGCSIYLMDKIAGNKKYSLSNIGFGLYFLSLFNLMFNWGHHVYTLPIPAYIKDIGYLVSMTELFIFGRMIWQWKSSVNATRKHFQYLPYRFLLAADCWVFFTLALAIPMSVPAINIYMHGTFTIVAHTMGATIGINSMLLLAFACEIFLVGRHSKSFRRERWIMRGFWIANISLVFFLASLLVAGFMKTYWQMNEHPDVPFATMMARLKPWFYSFYFTGVGIVTGLVMVVVPLLRRRYFSFAEPNFRKEDLREELEMVGPG